MVVATNAPAPVADAAASTNAPVATSQAPGAAIIPLIVMDDVPLTDAIKNLARQAGLNYMLDPKDPVLAEGRTNGQPAAQPSVSIRWENITAEQALNALLANYSLQMQEDPKTKIARITVKDPAAPDPLVTRIIQLKYANPSILHCCRCAKRPGGQNAAKWWLTFGRANWSCSPRIGNSMTLILWSRDWTQSPSRF